MAKHGTSYREAEKPKKKRPLLPILGLSLAILLGVVAVMVAGPLLEFGEEQSDGFSKQLNQFRNDPQFENLPDDTPEYVTAALLWFILMGLAMFIASAAVAGTDAERKAYSEMGPSPANKDAVVKQLKRDLKEAKKREQQRKRR